ncbi:MAG TPA: APC family permease, partial [Balneolaceae bacterium]|nr:APC family permease [Balneolaceae bacterium]
TTPGYAVAIALLALFTAVNFIGIRLFEKLNNALVWWKLAIIAVVIVVFFIVAFNGSHFDNPTTGGFFPFGWEGVFSAIATAGVVFSFLGFRQGVELAGETDNPSRNVPIAVIGSILITAILYVLLQVAFIGTLPVQAFAEGWANIGAHFAGELSDVAATFGPLAAIAGVMGLTWLAVLLYIDAFISPADTGLIYTTVTSRLSYAMGLNGNAPRSLAKVNDKGVPYISVFVTFLAATAFFFLFPGWEKIVGFVTAGTVLSFGSGPVALLAMRKQLPDHKRPFKLPLFKVLSYFGFVAANLIVYWSGWMDVWKLMIATIIGFAILIIHERANREHTPDLEIRSGLWIIVWLIGLTTISYLGSYPILSDAAGNIGLLGVGIDVAVIAVFDLFIVWLAVKSRLPADKVKAHLEEPILPGVPLDKDLPDV